mmetsp:Transcript_11277/g.35612  ORF Transcript_11277/g.35612 Transcript_11277/m.35612 type:complete len:225 (-) Transcript_11277:205-879(-)
MSRELLGADLSTMRPRSRSSHSVNTPARCASGGGPPDVSKLEQHAHPHAHRRCSTATPKSTRCHMPCSSATARAHWHTQTPQVSPVVRRIVRVGRSFADQLAHVKGFIWTKLRRSACGVWVCAVQRETLVASRDEHRAILAHVRAAPHAFEQPSACAHPAHDHRVQLHSPSILPGGESRAWAAPWRVRACWGARRTQQKSACPPPSPAGHPPTRTARPRPESAP